MAKFLEIIAALSEAGGEYPETMFDDLLTAYDEDLSVPTAKINDLETASAAAIAEANTTIAALKSQNYDLLMSVGASGNAGGGTGDDDEELSDETDSDITPESLFGDKEND